MRFLKYMALASLGSIQLLAVPAWSRLTGTSCNACHATPTMQLNSTGLEFLKNGHRMDATKVDPKDQKLDNYISIVFKGRAYADKSDNKAMGAVQKPSTQLELHSFSIYTGGALSERFSYFAEMYLNENTGSTSGSNIVQGDASRKKMAEAFIQYNQPITKDTFLAIRGGEILPGILHVFGVGARSAEQRALVLNGGNVGSNPYKPFNRQQGVDATLVNKHFEFAVGVLNGSANTNSLDADNHKDVFASALWNFDSHESALGLYHYTGQYTNYATANDPSTAITFDNKFDRTGILARFIRDNWRVVGVYFTGKETFNAAGLEAKNKGYYALVDYNFSDSFGVFARTDYFKPRDDQDANTKQFIVGLNGMLYQSDKAGARWNLEYLDQDQKPLTGANVKSSQLRFQVTFGF
ncbi:MAG: hypothetical protein IPQ13_02820 [Holophagaceae bacterium]|nr:hypothetical protein [Holophagaceae bacterium]